MMIQYVLKLVMPGKERLEEAYQILKEDEDIDHMTVRYMDGQGGEDTATGYTVECEVAGEPFLKVVSESRMVNIPVPRIIDSVMEP